MGYAKQSGQVLAWWVKRPFRIKLYYNDFSV